MFVSGRLALDLFLKLALLGQERHVLRVLEVQRLIRLELVLQGNWFGIRSHRSSQARDRQHPQTGE